MDIFKIKDSNKIFKLSVDKYEQETNRKEPYFQIATPPPNYYALCPECENPIEIINLYIEQHKKRKEDNLPLYARHVNRNIKNIANYSQSNFDNCSLKNPSTITGGEKRAGNSPSTIEIINLLKNHTQLIYNFMSDIIGLKIREQLFNKIIENFKQSNGELYKGVTKFNLPYTILYMSDNNNISYEPLNIKSEFSKIIRNAIIEKSELFEISKYDVIVPKTNFEKGNYKALEIYFSDHKLKYNNSVESMLIIIKENNNNKLKEILKETIEFRKKDLFINSVNKEQRLKEISKSYYP
ncbi:hypothetical protein [Aliarcobacter butzleri]|uniref:hypothetical protein n=1 Tax=Aliarcobacter butzleri TaxID=28197 RepID=UPI003AF56968